MVIHSFEDRDAPQISNPENHRQELKTSPHYIVATESEQHTLTGEHYRLGK